VGVARGGRPAGGARAPIGRAAGCTSDAGAKASAVLRPGDGLRAPACQARDKPASGRPRSPTCEARGKPASGRLRTPTGEAGGRPTSGRPRSPADAEALSGGGSPGRSPLASCRP